jgi:hypothetical protein
MIIELLDQRLFESGASGLAEEAQVRYREIRDFSESLAGEKPWCGLG